MGGTERRIFLGTLALLALVAALYFYQSFVSAREVDVYSVSVLLCGEGENFEKGLNSAALEHNADLHIVRVTDPSPAAQTAALERELKNGAAAVILYLADADALGAWLTRNAASPLVFVGDEPLPGKGASCVCLDIAAQAAALAAEMRLQPKRSVTLVESDDTDAARLAALGAALGAEGFTFDLAHAGETSVLPADGVFVALDPAAMQTLAEARNEGALLYGLGYAAALYAPLESGRITALAIVSEFDAGYLAVTEAVSRIGGVRAENAALAAFIARPDNLFEPPVSTVLFPIG